jgi:hypothetical protein
LVCIIKIKMEIKITNLEILERPNDLELGKYVREKYWNESDNRVKNSDEHVKLVIDDDGQVVGIEERSDDEYDSCVVCGRKTRYTKNTHVDMRIGYIDGFGQTCDRSCRN